MTTAAVWAEAVVVERDAVLAGLVAGDAGRGGGLGRVEELVVVAGAGDGQGLGRVARRAADVVQVTGVAGAMTTDRAWSAFATNRLSGSSGAP